MFGLNFFQIVKLGSVKTSVLRFVRVRKDFELICALMQIAVLKNCMTVQHQTRDQTCQVTALSQNLFCVQQRSTLIDLQTIFLTNLHAQIGARQRHV